jgi:hypothetical protein
VAERSSITLSNIEKRGDGIIGRAFLVVERLATGVTFHHPKDAYGRSIRLLILV